MPTRHNMHTHHRRLIWILWIAWLLTLSACTHAPIIHDNPRLRALRASIVSYALHMQGTPYRYGGIDARGFDCSGLVVYSYQKAGVPISRTTDTQFRSSMPIYPEELQPGDLVFYRITNSIVSHVGIYMGNDQFIHAPGKGKRVRIENLKDSYWQQHFVGAGSLSGFVSENEK